MKKSPCAKCQYLSDDKRACMFFIHKEVPFTDAIDFGDGYPDGCLAIEDLESIMDHYIDEHENAWEKMLEMLDLRRDLQDDLRERGI